MARVVVVSSSEIDTEALADVVSPDDELIVVVPAVSSRGCSGSRTTRTTRARGSGSRRGGGTGGPADASGRRGEARPAAPGRQ